MCVIIAKKAGVEPLKDDYFDNAWDHNPDGGGIVWKEKGKRVMFQKGFMNKKDMLEVLKKVNQKDTSFIAHFRIKSVGDVKPENCHPFVMKNITFAHNGTLGITPLEGKTDSETFGLAILAKRTMNWIKNNRLLLEMALGSSKFAIMDNNSGEIFILNPELGKERDDAWFSNDSAFTPATRTVYYPQRWPAIDDDYEPYSRTPAVQTFLPDKTLGTKHFTAGTYFMWKEDQYHWVDRSTTAVKRPYHFKSTVCVGKNGLWMLDKNIRPGDGLEAKMYNGKSCPEYSYLVHAQTKLNKLIAEYRSIRFKSWDEREDYETEIHAQALVLNACRRLVVAKKALSFDNLTAYIYDSVEDGMWQTAKTGKEYLQMVSFYIEECVDVVNSKTKTLSKHELQMTKAAAANA